MNRDRRKLVEEIYQLAADLPASERDGLLDEKCGDDTALRDEVQTLLKHLDDAGSEFLARSPSMAELLRSPALREAGEELPESTEIGPYRILEKLGEGGFGTVYIAEQSKPVRRQVALKILKAGMDTKAVLARFEAERQALALMEHPGIARVLDAGESETGRSYFVMELVRGEPITDYCDRHKLTTKQRLELFISVCQAVQHAHQKGVIHRDLKPSNILVTEIDGERVPKVIDFGIAKATTTPLTDKTLHTLQGQMIGTPAYMSPEQADMTGLNVDTTSDIYSLGVILYQLLTGLLPHDSRVLMNVGLENIHRVLRDVDPPTPSTRISKPDVRSSDVAQLRKTDARILARELRGDLDWIVMKALEKDRTRRYQTANQLALEIRRYLNDEPVEAGPPSAVYRFKKFARRHRIAIGVVAAVLFGLLGAGAGLVYALIESNRQRAATEQALEETESARRESDAVTDFLSNMLAAVDPGEQGRNVSMREVLDAAAGRLEGRFAGQPQVEASVRQTIGETYLSLGELDAASPHLEGAVTLREAALGPDHASTLESVHKLGELRFYQGRGEEAQRLLRRCVEGRERTLGPDDPETLLALSDLGAVMHGLGRLDEAERCYRDAYDRATDALGADDEYTLSMTHNLGALMRDLGRFDESESYLRRALEGSRRQLGDEHPETLSTLSLLGSVLREADRLEEAEPIYWDVLEAKRRVLGEEHPSTLLSANNLAMLLADVGRLDEAAEMQRTTLDAQTRVLGADHDDRILTLRNLGSILIRLGRPAEAEPLLAESVERCRRTLGEDHPLCAQNLTVMGECLTVLERYEEAEHALLEAHSVLTRVYAADHPSATQAAEKLASLYEAWGRLSDAAAWRARAGK